MKRLAIVLLTSLLLCGCWEKYSPGKHVDGFNGGGKPHTDMPVSPVPEPSTVLLLGAGFVALAAFARRK